jgi:hypothetical protein
MPRKTDHDIGFDAQGNPFAVGDEASAGADAIVDDPRATPILIVAARDNAIGVRVFGGPSAKTADVLDHIARTYRRALEAATGPRQ